MKISKKQLNILTYLVHEYKTELQKLDRSLTKYGQERIDYICTLLEEIINQQSTELVEVNKDD